MADAQAVALTDEHHEWATQFTGVDTRPVPPVADPGQSKASGATRPAMPPAPTANAALAGTTPTEATPAAVAPAVGPALSPNVPGVSETFELQFEAPKATPIWGGKAEVKWKAVVQITGSFLPDAGGQFQGGYNSKEQAAFKIARKWSLENLMKDLGAPDILTKAKLGGEAKYSDAKGISVKAGVSISGKFGSGEVSGVIFKKEPGKDIVYGGVEFSYGTPAIPLVDAKEDGFQIAKITVVVKASASLQPKYIKIIADELLKDAAVEGATVGAGSAGTAAGGAETGGAAVGAEAGSAAAGGAGTAGSPALVAAAPVAGVFGGIIGGLALCAGVCAAIGKLQDLGADAMNVCQDGERQLRAYAASYGSTMRGKPGGDKKGNDDAESTLQAIMAKTPGLTHDQAVQAATESKVNHENVAYTRLIPTMRERIVAAYKDKEGTLGYFFSGNVINQVMNDVLPTDGHY